MPDNIDPSRRSANMARIRGRNTTPELRVRSALHRLGYRFRIHVSSLPGTPDVVLPKYSTVVLVHGCFWHRHEGCRFSYTPKSHSEFWQAKFKANIQRDRRVIEQLELLGWRVVVIWECETKDPERLRHLLLAAMSDARQSTS